MSWKCKLLDILTVGYKMVSCQMTAKEEFTKDK